MPSQTETILVADGEPASRDLIAQQVLAPLGYAVTTASDGPAALQSALSLQPDIIFAALDLPGLSALDLLAALRSRSAASLVIVIGPRSAEHRVLQAFRLGARDVLLKPLREAELVTALDRAVGELRLRREREQFARQLTSANQQLEKRLQELMALHALGLAAGAASDLNRLFVLVLEAAARVTAGDLAWLQLAEPGRPGPLVLKAARRFPPEAGPQLDQPWDDGLAAQVLGSGQGLRLAGEPLAGLGAGRLVHAAVAAPLKARGGVIGVIAAGNRSGADFSERDLAMLAAVAEYAAAALVNLRLLDALNSRARALQKACDEIAGRLAAPAAGLTALLDGELGPLSDPQAQALRQIAGQLGAALPGALAPLRPKATHAG